MPGAGTLILLLVLCAFFDFSFSCGIHEKVGKHDGASNSIVLLSLSVFHELLIIILIFKLKADLLIFTARVVAACCCLLLIVVATDG